MRSLHVSQGLDLQPPARPRSLEFNTKKRVWRSIRNPRQFLKLYKKFQQQKLDPEVFAVEEAVDMPEKGEDFVAWFQQARYTYYKSQNRLDRLYILERTRDWPRVFGMTTKVSNHTLSKQS